MNLLLLRLERPLGEKQQIPFGLKRLCRNFVWVCSSGMKRARVSPEWGERA